MIHSSRRTVTEVVSSKTFFLVCSFVFLVLALDQGSSLKVFDRTVDLPTYSFFSSRSDVYMQSLGDYLSKTGLGLSGEGTVVGVINRFLSKVTMGRTLGNGPIIFAILANGAIVAYHSCVLALDLLFTKQRPQRREKEGEKKHGDDDDFMTRNEVHLKGALRFAIILVFGYVSGGKGFGAETFTMDLLKSYFGRMRPAQSTSLASLAFPSGHTNGTSFFVGSLYALMLPNLCKALKTNPGLTKPKLGTAAGSLFESVCLDYWSVWWGGLVVLTAFGRVVMNRHWVSDTLAGGIFGAAVVSLQCGTCLFVEKKIFERNENMGRKKSD